MIFFITKEFNI